MVKVLIFIAILFWAIRLALIALEGKSAMNVLGIVIIIGLSIWMMKSVLFQGVS